MKPDGLQGMKLKNITKISATNITYLKYSLTLGFCYIWSCYDKFKGCVAFWAKPYFNNAGVSESSVKLLF